MKIQTAKLNPSPNSLTPFLGIKKVMNSFILSKYFVYKLGEWVNNNNNTG